MKGHMELYLRDIYSQSALGSESDHWKRSWTNENMLLTGAYRTSYLTAMVTFAVSVIIFQIFTVEICMTLTFDH